MQLSLAGEAFIKSWEKCRLTAYQDGGGVWTIGWGHTGPEVRRGLVWTQAQADAAFRADVKWAVAAVERLTKFRLNQNHLDALVSFVYNIGESAFAKSTMLKFLNMEYYWRASKEFKRWVYDNGVKVRGLERRRESERKLFLTPDAPGVPPARPHQKGISAI